MTRARRLIVAGLALLVGLAVAGPAMAQGGVGAATVEVRVWQNVDDDRDLYVSARPAGGSWRTLGTAPLALDGAGARYRYGDIALAVPDAVVIRVWQDVAEGGRFYVGARPAGRSWQGRHSLSLADGLGASGRYRYGDITIVVSLPDGVRPALGPVIPSVTVAFEDGFPVAERAGIEARLKDEFHDVAVFFAERYGLTAPGLTILMMRPADEKRIEYANNTIRMVDNFERIVSRSSDQHGNTLTIESSDFASLWAVAHEYVHALQDQLSGGRYGPHWMVEGMAVYLHYQYHDAIGRRTYERNRQLSLATARLEESSLRSMEPGFGNDSSKYMVSFLAVERLAERAGEGALFDFYRNMKTMPSWRAAFLDSFGLNADAFYEEFAEYRAENAPAQAYLEGLVLGLDGEPVRGIHIAAVRRAPNVSRRRAPCSGVTEQEWTDPSACSLNPARPCSASPLTPARRRDSWARMVASPTTAWTRGKSLSEWRA